MGWGGGGGVSCFHGHLNKCPLGDLNKSPWENYLEGGGNEENIKSTRFCKVHYVLNSDIKDYMPRNIKDIVLSGIRILVCMYVFFDTNRNCMHKFGKSIVMFLQARLSQLTRILMPFNYNSFLINIYFRTFW